MSKKKGRDVDCTEIVLNAIGEKGQAARKHFKEHLDNKSIVLKNTNAQLRASKAATRAKSNSARVAKVSRRQLKSKKLLPTDAKGYAVEESDVRRTHHLWNQFIDTVVRSCSNELQLQTKLYEAGLLGAYITRVVAVVEDDYSSTAEQNKKKEKKKKKHHLSGFVINETKNCLFLAVLPEIEGQGDSGATKGVVVKRVLKAPSMFTVKLPSKNSIEEAEVMILYGKQLLQLKEKSFGS